MKNGLVFVKTALIIYSLKQNYKNEIENGLVFAKTALV